MDPLFHKGNRSTESLSIIQEILDASPFASVILNHRQQVIISNSHLRKSRNKGIEKLVGNKTGKIIGCIHSANDCGTADSCRFCGIINTIRKCRASHDVVTDECRITVNDKGRMISFDFRVTCSPILLKGHFYTIMNLQDISSEKRKANLEKLFFHDILNRLGGLKGIIQLIKSSGTKNDIGEYLEMLETVGDMVIDDIQTQRYLNSAETDSLIISIRENQSCDIIDSIVRQVAFDPVMNSMRIRLVQECENFLIRTDSVLLKRILLNMVKNAAEATPAEGTILISSRKTKRNAVFSVHNPGKIPEHIQLQIFQRSFTTKGEGRGLGTYSMKLFGENFLKGKVGFKSSEHHGTTFFIELPL